MSDVGSLERIADRGFRCGWYRAQAVMERNLRHRMEAAQLAKDWTLHETLLAIWRDISHMPEETP